MKFNSKRTKYNYIYAAEILQNPQEYLEDPVCLQTELKNFLERNTVHWEIEKTKNH